MSVHASASSPYPLLREPLRTGSHSFLRMRGFWAKPWIGKDVFMMQTRLGRFLSKQQQLGNSRLCWMAWGEHSSPSWLCPPGRDEGWVPRELVMSQARPQETGLHTFPGSRLRAFKDSLSNAVPAGLLTRLCC